jgi:hypothetical protein
MRSNSDLLHKLIVLVDEMEAVLKLVDRKSRKRQITLAFLKCPDTFERCIFRLYNMMEFLVWHIYDHGIF